MDSLPPRPTPALPLGERIRDWIEWFGVARLAVGACSVLAVVLGGYWLLRPPAPPVEASLPMAAGATMPGAGPAPDTSAAAAGTASAAGEGAGSPGATAVPATIVVHVAGAVVAPGVYRLPGGARVVDAVTAAGGAAVQARTDAVNLAAPLRDGDRVYVPTVDEAAPPPPGVSGPPGGAAADTTPRGPIDLNIATVDELDRLPGVGPATAAAIVAYREANGPFASVDALADVRGIGPAKLDAIRELVTT